MTDAIRIEFVSDFVCPWCYIGKRRLEAALAMRPEIAVILNWQPFQLTPEMPRQGRNRNEHYQQIFGAARAEAIIRNMQLTGAEEGIHFCAGPEAMSPNTLSAHVLMLWAMEDNAADPDLLAEKLFAAHHVDCADIGSHSVLTAIAGEAGLDSGRVAEQLAAGEDEDRVREQITRSVARGVTGVPFMIINERYVISGAQPPAVLVEALDRIVPETVPHSV